MQSLFVVAAGGTGAKVVESIVHLCAAGLGPAQLDVLLLDVDKENGNVERTRDAAELYAKLRTWDWTLSARSVAGDGGAGPLHGTRFFHTALSLHPCLEKISAVGNGGLSVHLHKVPGAHHLLDLLYNEQEQESECEKGFLARPNLGSLVLGGHLQEMFAAPSGGAASFKERLLTALNGASPGQPVALVVVGSIFGGTGASLFPVVCECLRKAVAVGQNGTTNWSKLAPVAVMLTPYFLPHQAPVTSSGQADEPVDPSRFLVDTANALNHYVNTTVLDGFKAVYLLGNDQPQANQLRYVAGARDQANPPLLEEVLAALAVFDAEKNIANTTIGARRVYQPPTGRVEWTSLPFPAQGETRLALLLELASFILLPAKSGEPLSGGLLHACRQWSGEFELLPWYERLLGGWARANFSGTYRPGRAGGWKQLDDANVLPGEAAASKAAGLMAEYAYRLLLWARTALPDADTSHLVKMGQEMDYAAVWEVMCGLTPAEIEPTAGTAAGIGDNALVRLARAAAVALAKIAAGQHLGGIINTETSLPGFPGQGGPPDQPCSLPIAVTRLPELAKLCGINTEVHGKFVKTEVTH